MRDTVCVVLGGGRGTRLHPLTLERAKPAVPLGGKYRLIDIPVSNCLNSGLNRIYVLTQFNTASLHRHINHTYKFDDFGGGFVEILAAEQTDDSVDWYQGTADAVRQNLRHLRLGSSKQCLILSGDQLYRMDFQRMIRAHEYSGAAITIAVIPVRREEASSLGILRVDDRSAIVEFREKPKDPELLDELALDPEVLRRAGIEPGDRTHLASMGIYIFSGEVLAGCLDDDTADDFGGQVIPNAIGHLPGRVFAYPFDGYWEDIGTIPAFFEANLDLASPMPRFNFFDETAPVWTHPRYLPPSKLNECDAQRVVIGDGSVVDRCRLRQCVIGLRSVIREGCDLERVVMMGADFFETEEHRKRHSSEGLPPVGLGRGVTIRNAIIDKNARIGDGAVIVNEAGVQNREGPEYWIRDGIIIVPRSGVIAPGTVA